MSDYLAAAPGLQSSLARDLVTLAPEMVLIGTMVLILFLRIFDRCKQWNMLLLAAGGTIAAATLTYLLGSYLAGDGENPIEQNLFGALLKRDQWSDGGRLLIQLFVAGLLLFQLCTRFPNSEDAVDYCTLLLGSTLGLCIMTMSQHLLMLFISLEMASLPAYALAGFLKQQRFSGEAALKYALYGSVASGILLFGITWIVLASGTGYYLPVQQWFLSPTGGHAFLGQAGLMLLLIGFGFKLAIVPMHFWMPDILQSAAAEVGGFLSVASKVGAFLLLARFLAPITTVISHVDYYLIAAMLTATVGNLFAFTQTNLKRLLAYSSIAHSGYLLTLLFLPRGIGLAPLLFYLIGYAIANGILFVSIALNRQANNSEQIESWNGLIQHAPWLVIAVTLSLISLLGLPPLLGFAGKFVLFSALFEANTLVSFVTLILFGINTIISAGYYLQLIKRMTLEDSLMPLDTKPIPFLPQLFLFLLGLGAVGLGVAWGLIYDGCDAAAKSILP